MMLYTRTVKSIDPMDRSETMIQASNTLSDAEAGSTVVVRKLCVTPETAMRLRELGLRESVTLRVVSNDAPQLICELRHTRIGLHHHVAKDVLVTLEK